MFYKKLHLKRIANHDSSIDGNSNDDDDDDDAVVNEIVHTLSQDELEMAARMSYEYMRYPLTTAPEHRRLHYAKQMAKRFLDSSPGRDKAEAVRNMKKTIQFRRDKKIDALRTALSDPKSEFYAPLKQCLSNGHLYVQGYDRDGRSTYVFVPRRVNHHDSTWTLREHLWTLERAIACSRVPDKSINAMVDFNGFSVVRHAPPTAIGQEIMTTLRLHYVGHINQIFLLDVPAAFLCLWAIFKPFVGKVARTKINFVSSDQEKRSKIGRWYEKDQAAAWMLPSGKKNRELDIDEYLLKTPFDRAFDDWW